MRQFSICLGLCLVLAAPGRADDATPAPAPAPASTPEPAAAPAPASTPAAAPAPASTTPAPVAAPAPESTPAPVAAPAPASATASDAGDPAAQDAERPPPADPLRPPPPSGPFARLALGVGVALLTDGDESDLRLPTYGHLDLGYAFSPAFALTARVGSWFSFEPWGQSFIGVGASFGFEPERFEPESMFVTALLGVSLSDDAFFFDGNEDIQGLGLHLDLGQRWTLTPHLYFEVGAHFELGTPLFTNSVEYVSLGIGPFVAVRIGG